MTTSDGVWLVERTNADSASDYRPQVVKALFKRAQQDVVIGGCMVTYPRAAHAELCGLQSTWIRELSAMQRKSWKVPLESVGK